jgi:hypothetical protein
MTTVNSSQKYAVLALKLGDLTVKSWAIQEQIKATQAEIAALSKEIEDES